MADAMKENSILRKRKFEFEEQEKRTAYEVMNPCQVWMRPICFSRACPK